MKTKSLLRPLKTLLDLPVVACAILLVFLMPACSSHDGGRADSLNDLAYDFHYRSLDSTLLYARKAEKAAGNDDGGVAEAYNHKAFVSIARMQYDLAAQQLDSVTAITDNQVELLIADVQQMRLCQRQSRNKDFYTYRENALRRLKRISEEEASLSDHMRRRLVYARSELAIVTSTYYYYVGLEQQSVDALHEIDGSEVLKDTAQLLNYYYNVGAGGIITEGTQEEINQKEMEYLFRCNKIAREYGYPFWEANSMQAMSEHLQVPVLAERLMEDNYSELRKINIDDMPDSLLAGNLALRSLDIFQVYGDVYQTAGSYRTLAQCFWYIADYESSLDCLNKALTNDTAIFQAPDLVASIQEQLSVVYAAINDKTNSHLNRNLYLDTQDKTRQDLFLQSRAEQLRQSVNQLNIMTASIIALMLVGVALLFLFYYLRKRSDRNNSLDALLLPLEQWKKENATVVGQLNDRYDETMEQMAVSRLHIEKNKQLNLEQRAKVSLANMVIPYIDRMLHEIHKLRTADEEPSLRAERYAYLAELTDKIIDYNDILTQWIQLRKGDLSLRIESFPLQTLFEIVEHSRRAFQLKGIELEVTPTDQWVKADRILTLFMINTMADNARKFTPDGGSVTVSATDASQYVEVSITDTGIGMNQQQMAEVFSVEKKHFGEDVVGASDGTAKKVAVQKEPGHGFGLVNCKGIIEKYKKISSLFSVCDIGVESTMGKGSRFYFRLPKGTARTLLALALSMASWGQTWSAAVSDSLLRKASGFSDSIYVCNTDDRYEEAICYADSTIDALNKAYHVFVKNGSDTLVLQSDKSVLQSEIQWYHNHLPFDYDVILRLRNESAVAALALHEWAIYRYNNKVYTQLYKEMSADSTLSDYCRVMQKSKSNKYMAVVILIILSILILMAYFLLYYRHRVYYRFCLERVRAMNDVLRSETDDRQKLATIERLAGNVEGRDGGSVPHRRSLYDNERLPEPLQKIADELIQTLQTSISANQKRLTDIDLAEDEVRKLQFENDKLHVSNSVLDNCLSTLKHETMYYPSRIRTLIESGDGELQSISELADYYKEIYTLLGAQTMRQVENVKPECVSVSVRELLPRLDDKSLQAVHILGDKQMLRYLIDLLRKQGGGEQPAISVEEKDDRYIRFRFSYPSLQLTEEECYELFNPARSNVPFLLCRQIVRDVGEATNARGCGIMAEVNAKGLVDIVVTLVKARHSQNRTIEKN